MNRDFFSDFPCEVKFNEDASNHCTFKLGGALEHFVCPKSVDEFCQSIRLLSEKSIRFKVVGNMSNILPEDGLNKGVIITTKYIADEPKISGNRITAYAGTNLSSVCLLAASSGLSGMEGLIGIPATVGGAVFNNAGAFGQSVSDTLESLLIFSNGKIISKPASYANLSYRKSAFQTNGDIVISATFALIPKDSELILEDIKQIALKRASTQPHGPSAGSVFKKHEMGAAGYFIEQAGLKGLIYKGAQISDKHANFIINLGTASSDSVKYLVDLAQSKVYQKFNVKLTREIEYLGENNESTSRLSHTQQI